MADFLTSDHHVGHRYICEYAEREFQDINKMSKIMGTRWNKVVGRRDRVIHLGDVSFLPFVETAAWLRGLNGKKLLIMGNHDRAHTRSWWLKAGFDEVIEYPILYQNYFLLSHEPVTLPAGSELVNIHGHIHQKDAQDENHINICVEKTDYYPVLFDDIVKRFEVRFGEVNK